MQFRCAVWGGYPLASMLMGCILLGMHTSSDIALMGCVFLRLYKTSDIMLIGCMFLGTHTFSDIMLIGCMFWESTVLLVIIKGQTFLGGLRAIQSMLSGSNRNAQGAAD